MDPQDAHSLRRLLDTRPVASLATLHRGEPAVSMVPFVRRDDGALLIHVSALATHTRDLQEHPRVSLMVMAEPDDGTPPQALPRVTLQVAARMLPREGDEYAAAKALYLARFPDAAVTFELADFAIVVLQPESARLVAGFGRAFALVGEKLDQWLRS
ncbi:MAG: hypothetical protein E6Q93_25655 [Burkholderiaceae bacterium]|nr:MAG: hypothetical protein E6Q93_25655 [Burkholderiaceae bacterium]